MPLHSSLQVALLAQFPPPRVERLDLPLAEISGRGACTSWKATLVFMGCRPGHAGTEMTVRPFRRRPSRAAGLPLPAGRG